MRARLIAALILAFAIPAAAEQPILVVALFRHGIRAPLGGFANNAHAHSEDAWPSLNDWHATHWGDLTANGTAIVTLIGKSYARQYAPARAYFWADTDQRTVDTANALANGYGNGATVHFLPGPGDRPGGTDPLFHPFRSGCGRPDAAILDQKAKDLDARWTYLFKRNRQRFRDLYRVLSCPRVLGAPCTPLADIRDKATACPRPEGECEAPLQWKGQFSYASSASEAFLLEYANNMQVGWDRVTLDAIKTMLPLHERFFESTDRDPYVARIETSNLLREIFDLLNRKAGRPVLGCPHGGDEPFVGLVGHDTNLAGVGALLGFQWRFRRPYVPADTAGLPNNDALPAGALVFELYPGDPDFRVKVIYVTTSLAEMRTIPKDNIGLYRLPVAEMPLRDLSAKLRAAIDPNFVSQCRGGQQFCGRIP